MQAEKPNQIRLSSFLNSIRDLIALADGFDGGENFVETIVNDIIMANPVWHGIALDIPLRDDLLEQRIFRALMGNPQIDSLVLWKGPAHDVCQVLDRAIPLMPRLENITFKIFRMSSEEAEAIFALLSNAPAVEFLHVILKHPTRDYYDGVLDALARYVQESTSLLRFHLTCSNRGGLMSLGTFRSLCEALSESECLRDLGIEGRPVDDSHAGMAAECLSNAVVSGFPSLTSVKLYQYSRNSGEFTADRFCRALKQSDAVKESNLFFRRSKKRHRRFGKYSLFRMGDRAGGKISCHTRFL